MVLDNADIYYSFDDADLTGSDPDDVSGNGFNGTSANVTTGVTGKILEMFTFNGTNGSVESGFDSTFKTLSFWISTTSTSNDVILSCRFNATEQAGNFHLEIRGGGTGEARLSFYNPGLTNLSGVTDLTD